MTSPPPWTDDDSKQLDREIRAARPKSERRAPKRKRQPEQMPNGRWRMRAGGTKRTFDTPAAAIKWRDSITDTKEN